MVYEKPKWLINEEKSEQLEFAQDVIEEMDRYSNQLIDENHQLTQENAALRQQVAGLRGALEAIASKSDPERPKKWENEQDTSYGVTIGLWRAGVIAREALQAAAEASGEG